jgi:Flp pilus assembly protein TadB
MAPHVKWGIAGVALGVILVFLNLPWVGLALIVLAIGIPTAAWLMLDPSQRRRIKEMRRRQLNR